MGKLDKARGVLVDAVGLLTAAAELARGLRDAFRGKAARRTKVYARPLSEFELFEKEPKK